MTERSGMPCSAHVDVSAALLNEAADELSWIHREYMSRNPFSEGVPRIIRLLKKIELRTGHVAASPYPPENAEKNSSSLSPSKTTKKRTP